MGFEFKDSALLHLGICGKEYVCAPDSPDFIEWFKANKGKLESPAMQYVDDSDAHEVIDLCVGLVTSLLGADASNEIFSGKPASLTQFCMLIAYIMGEMANQDVMGKLNDMADEYGQAAILS